MSPEEDRLDRGKLHAALANEIGRVVAEFSGRGATRSRAFISHDVVVCVLEDAATKAERHLVAVGQADLVRLQREALQRAMEARLSAAVERLTGRTVRSVMAGSSAKVDSLVEVFLLEPEASG